MAKLMQTQFNRGSLIEKVSNTAFTVTGSPVFKDTEKGMALAMSTWQKLVLPSFTWLNSVSKFTCVSWIKFRTNASWNSILDRTTGVNARTEIAQGNDNNFYIFIAESTNYAWFANTDLTNYHQYVVIFDGTQTGNANRLKVYVDWVQKTLLFGNTIPATTHSSTANLNIWFGTYSTASANENINKVELFTDVWTQSDVNKDYAKFLKSACIKKAKRVIKLKPNDLSSQKFDTVTKLIATNCWWPDTTDFIDSNSDGLADNLAWWLTNSIVTGNGFTGRAQRSSWNFTTVRVLSVPTNWEYFKISFKYRCDVNFQVKSDNNTIATFTPNTGNAIVWTCEWYLQSANILFQTTSNGYFEFDELVVTKLTWCVAAYNMIKLPWNKINDISGNWQILTINWTPLSTNDWLRPMSWVYASTWLNFWWYTNFSIMFRAKCLAGENMTIEQYNSSSAKIMCRYYNGVATFWFSSTINATCNMDWSWWTDYHFVYNGAWATNADKAKIYINWVSQTLTFAWTVPSVIPAMVWTPFGVFNSPSQGSYSVCEISDLRFWNRTLSAGEIAKYHNSQINTFIETFENNGADWTSCLPEWRSQISGTRKIWQYWLAEWNKIVTNAGSIYTTDRVDTNTDWLADNWSKVNNPTCTIVTGNGFTGRAQRCVAVNAGTSDWISNWGNFTVGKNYKLTMKYRASSNTACRIYCSGSDVIWSPITNTWNAITYTCYFKATTWTLNFYVQNATDWFEVSDIVVTGVQWLPVGTKYVESISASKMVTFKPNALWEFEIAFMKTDNSSPMAIFVNWNWIQDYNNVNNKGYVLYVEGTYMDYYRTYIANLQWRQSAGAIQFWVWYFIKRTLSTAWVHTWYIKWGQYGNTYTLVTWLSLGTNPITDTNNIWFGGYLQIQHWVGDRIALIKDKDSLPA